MPDVALPVHVAAGATAIVTGAAALLSRKGQRVHRSAGLLFVGAMIVMGLSGSYLALGKASAANLLGGVTAAYFAVTGFLTMRTRSPWAPPLTLAALLIAGVIGTSEVVFGVTRLAAGRLIAGGVPVPMTLFLATVTLAAAAGDLRLLRSGPPKGVQRLRRHLWRMCFGLFMAAGSFFSIRARVARVLPEIFLAGPVRVLPILLVFVAMFYWIWSVGRRQKRPSTAPLATANSR